jgi:hypothetical protein
MQKVVDIEVIWIHVKNYLFKEFWMKKYTACMNEIPKWQNMHQIVYINTPPFHPI